MIAEFIIPGRQNGPILQRLGVDSPKRVTVNIEGVSNQQICCPASTQINNLCTSGISLPADVPPAEIAGMVLTQNQETFNAIDGSYSVSRSYIQYNS